jgi:hypothetical protein
MRLVEGDSHEAEEIARWLDLWITETIPRSKSAKGLLYFASACRKFSRSSHGVFYRGITVRSIPKTEVIEIDQHPKIPLESWTANKTYAELYAAKRHGIVLTATQAELDILLDTDNFNATHPLPHHQSGEVIVVSKPASFHFYVT